MALCFAGALFVSGVARAQGTPRGFWTVPDGDPAHNSWQKAETEITTETVGKDFKFLWKLKLGNGPAKSSSFSEPLLFPGLITGRGFKDMALWADANTLYAVDSELGALVWQKDFKLATPGMWRVEYSGSDRGAASHPFRRPGPPLLALLPLRHVLLKNPWLLPRVALALLPEADISG